MLEVLFNFGIRMLVLIRILGTSAVKGNSGVFISVTSSDDSFLIRHKVH
jgi:hypothetical protein